MADKSPVSSFQEVQQVHQGKHADKKAASAPPSSMDKATGSKPASPKKK